MKTTILTICILLASWLPSITRAEGDEMAIGDTLMLHEVVVASSKENVPLRQQALSSSTFTASTIREKGMTSVKDLSAIVPGLYIPSYGSRLTTSVYLRGVGSRINTPSVGMYMDGVPLVEKSAFDFNIADVERIEVLRGPQSTLYGRNTMGGLIRITTKDPLNYTGSDLMVGAATYNSYKASATHYHRLSPRFGFVGAVSYNHDGGYFKNVTLADKRADMSDDLGARLRLVGRPSSSVRLDFQANYEYSRQGAYPYAFNGWTSAEAQANDYFATDIMPYLGFIGNNRESLYDRHLLNLGLTAEHTWKRFVLSNILGFQYLRDEMNMDQDFTAKDIYTLDQRQNSRILSEEVVLKSRPQAWRHWQWTTGASVFYQWLATRAPVAFRSDGIEWLNDVINRSANAHMPQIQSGPMTMAFDFDDQLQGTSIPFDGRYKTPTASAAIYHQSTVNDLFGAKGLNLTLGLRLDYEKMSLDHNSWYDLTHTYQLKGHLQMSGREMDIQMVAPDTYEASNSLSGRLSHDYLQLLPKFSLQYGFAHGNLYVTASRGYRSGGYNIQMFSEVLQSMMRTDIMSDVRDVTLPILQAQPSVPDAAKTQVTTILNQMATPMAVDVSELCLYRPEYAWNYELGTHLTFHDGRLMADASVFYNDVRDQQISRMAQSGLGRITVNAGRSRSIGMEASLSAQITSALSAHASYGFTHSTFRDYQLNDTVNLRGNHVPFIPRHTIDVGARYRWTLSGWLQHIVLNADYHMAGRIWWTELNNVSQRLYGTLDARATFTHDNIDISLWGNNLTNQSYHAFCFESMNRSFVQKGRPLQAGIEVRIHL